MSQNLRSQPGEGSFDAGRGSAGNRERKQYEGFEGMNFEQQRQPYKPQRTAGNREDDVENGRSSGHQNDEL